MAMRKFVRAPLANASTTQLEATVKDVSLSSMMRPGRLELAPQPTSVRGALATTVLTLAHIMPLWVLVSAQTARTTHGELSVSSAGLSFIVFPALQLTHLTPANRATVRWQGSTMMAAASLKGWMLVSAAASASPQADNVTRVWRDTST
jgi:hypothetical protein